MARRGPGPKEEAAKNEMNRLWRLGCMHDNIGTANKFVVWSPANPFSTEYSAAVKLFLRLKRARMERAARKDVLDSLWMKEVRGSLGGRYIE
jgi:hypothetical protein